jgi:nucleoside-diphosphate-sugar epimerase
LIRLVVGCGFLGLRAAKLWKNQGDKVYAVTRSEHRAETFRKLGLHPIVADVTKPETLQLPQTDTVLLAVGMDRTAYSDIRMVYVDGLKNVLSALDDSVKQLIYISSTGVYGNFDGEWVSEDSPTEPSREGGHACLAAEELIKDSRFADRATILRFAGIYGPDRVPTQKLIQSKSWNKLSANGYLNLIHADDGANIVRIVADQAPSGETFLVSDGSPPLRREYYEFIAEFFNEDIQWNESPPDPNDRSSNSKRIANTKLTARFQFNFQYPDYKSGLNHALKV